MDNVAKFFPLILVISFPSVRLIVVLAQLILISVKTFPTATKQKTSFVGETKKKNVCV